MIVNIPLEAWKDHLKAQIVRLNSNSLCEDFLAANQRYEIKKG